ncbi:HlyU family transcriptional regulator [Cognatishimia sp. F0-27]|uniref:HlyU family transcriptional regulator n=1 Tax=Cognatishimia sp. F0-27 TaxID=2816855 RepID=UPI001D0CC90C|nr:HlyU family transcriptional regulator [Cognatishimia sp. F0-27]MCC1491730.1 hypothetical protein [Cognatishimia sp. F0-27]
MSWLSKIFGGGSGDSASAQPEAQATEYKGFRIIPAPMKADGGYRIAARIEQDADGGPKVHQLVRADVINDYDMAVEASLGKARQMIDEQGAGIFS